MPFDTVQNTIEPHVLAAIVCIVLSFVALGVGWLVDAIHKDMKR
jgi:hypothetical protein